MNFEKIKEMLKTKKVKIVTGVILGALVVSIAGGVTIYNKIKVESNIVEENKHLAVSNNKEKEELEKLKEVDTSKLSEEEKKEIENKKTDIENKIANEEVKKDDELNKKVASTNSNSSSNSKNNENDVVQNNSTISNTVQTKPNNTTTTNNKNEHTHDWVPITSVVHHDEVGHWENVLVKEAWVESVPVYKEEYRAICNTCGADITDNYAEHIRDHMLKGENGSYRNEVRQVQVGTNTINHEAVYEKKWVVDKAAWNETIVTGYKCSVGGETK